MSDRRNHRGTVDVKEDVRFKKYVTSPPLMTVEWLFDEVKKLVDYLWNLTDEIAIDSQDSISAAEDRLNAKIAALDARINTLENP